MYIENLRIPDHLSEKEYVFVQKTRIKIEESGYNGPVSVVGSRADGSRISTRAYASECRFELTPESYVRWLSKLNEIARTFDLSAGNIKEIFRHLPANAPPEIRFLVNPKNTFIRLDSDLDLVINYAPTGDILGKHVDDPYPVGSGMTIDIFIPENELFVHLPTNYDY